MARLQFHGIGSQEHSAQAHHVTTCMHEHAHYKMEGEISRGASASVQAQGQQPAQPLGEGQLSLSAWLEKSFSKGKSLLRSIWGSSETPQAGEAGDRSGQAQVMAQIGDSRELDGRGASANGQQSQQPDSFRTPHAAQIAQAAAAVPPESRVQEEAYAAASQAVGGQEGNLWQKIKVRFKDIAGHLTGHLQSQPQAKSSFQANQERPREERRRMKKPGRDAVEIASYHVEESYLLDSYDRKGGYSKLSTKK